MAPRDHDVHLIVAVSDTPAGLKLLAHVGDSKKPLIALRLSEVADGVECGSRRGEVDLDAMA
jgi:hypothetical protein